MSNIRNLPTTEKKTKLDKVREFKNKQYKDLIADYEKMSNSIEHMTDVIDSTFLKLENNIKDDDDTKVSAKVNALSTLVFTALKLQEHKMDLHNNFDELVNSIIPEDVVAIANEEIKNDDIIDPLANIKKNKELNQCRRVH